MGSCASIPLQHICVCRCRTMAPMGVEHRHGAPSQWRVPDRARDIIPAWRPAAHARAPHERRVVVNGRAEQGRPREDAGPREHPRVEPLAHLAHPVDDGDGSTPHAHGRWTTHRHPRGALAPVPATLCERTPRVRAPIRAPLRHQTILRDRRIAPKGVWEPVPGIGTHLRADIPISWGCDTHAGAPRCRGPGAVQGLSPASSALSIPHPSSPDALH